MLASPSNRSQRRKLRQLIENAKSNVPLYKRLYADVSLSDQALSVPQMLERLPIITKSDLTSAPLDQRTNRRFDPKTLSVESTTGSTGQPFALRVDQSYIQKRNLRFLKGLLAAGYRPWQRLMLLTDRYADSTRAKLNRHYVSIEQSTSKILDAYQYIRPQVLYGFLTPLRLLAESLPSNSHRPKLIVSTAEMLDPRSRQQLETAFGCRVSDFYGLTEMGLVAHQGSKNAAYIMSSNSILTELIPDPNGSDRFRMIMTNLELHSSPVIRFESGDLAHVKTVDGRPAVVAIEGRCIDTIVRRDGSELSPYRITDALRDVAGLKRFKVTQRSVGEFHIELEVAAEARAKSEQNVRAILERLLGPDLNIAVYFRRKLIPDGARKFRPVESHVGRP